MRQCRRARSSVPCRHGIPCGGYLPQTRQDKQRNILKLGEAPAVRFAGFRGRQAETVYACCNLHGP